MLDAVAKAKSTGKPVVVDAMTDVASKTVANPNGTLTTTDNALPVRVKREGNWADIDSALRQNADGTVSPAVASTALTLSGGGTGPMATVATSDGKQLSVGAPFALPKPSLNGDTATYANVLPGVDLQVTALPVGGWRDVVIVRTPEAAANPALKTLRFPITAQGLTVASDDKGRIDVKDDKGSVRFRSPAPLQWDSSKPAAPAAAPEAASRSVTRTALAATPAADSASAPNAATPSTAEAPGDGANVASIGTRVTSDAIELTPDPQALGSGTGPWYLDPTLTAVTSYTQSSVEVQENHKDAKNWNTKSNLATGFCGYHSSDPSQDCGSEGRQRAYFQFGVNPAIYTQVGGAEVPPTLYTSTLNAQVTGASSPGTATNLGVYWAPTGINGDTNWYQQPCNDNGNQIMGGCTYVGGQPIKGTGPMAVDVTDMMKQAAAGKWATWTIGIAPSDTEWTKEYRHYIANNPSVTTTYDITPTVWYPHTIPAPGFANNNSTAECNTGGAHPWDNPGWVGSNQNINITASTYSPSGQPLYTGFHMWDDNDPNFSLKDGGWDGSYNNPGHTLPVGSLSDGHQYGWYAQSADGLLTSPMSAWCYFRVDKTNPRVSISSTDFPPSGTPNPSPAKYMNDWGTFTINADDPSPGPGLQASGVACVRVSTDPTPVVGWKCGQNGTLPPGQPYGYQPHQWGTNTLYAWAMDNAGNYSQPAVYNFYVPWKPGTQPLFGDIDNDQKADIVLADKNGDLRITGGTSDPATSTAAPAAAAPGNREYGATWADYQISHHGALTVGQPVDQLVAHYTKDNAPTLKATLYVLTNDGSGHFDQLTPLTPLRPTCTTYGTGTPCDPDYNAQDWSNASQVIAFGTPKGEAVGPKVGDPTKTVFTTQTSVMTLENNKLYVFNPAGNAFGSATLIPATSGSWNDLELINPGAANGPTTNPITKAVKNQTTLWARNRTTGDIFAYPLGWNTDGTVDYSALTTPDKGIKLNTTPVPAAAYPRIGAATLYNGDNVSLWAVDNNNAITIYPGLTTSGVAGKVDKLDGPQNAGYTDASFSVHPNSVSWQCMDAVGGPRDGTEIAIYSCWTTANQRFNLATDGTIRAGSYCLSTKDNALLNGTRVILTTCNGNTGQKWSMRPDGRIYLPATVDPANSPGGKCLELPGWATDQGTRLGIYDCPGLQANQQWTIAPERTP
ncbi:ricin-type beta-trefoil lectin domain protein [Kitasatospora sp. NPDC101155]|uniref:ricin-type beta-trefoil lectin domain protein n=1 Tax=Kitasatospora sp. NPDC101155 TaxID=3364097 RepID=UPI003805A19E